MSSGVYFVKRVDGLYKIGHTINLDKRLMALRGQYGNVALIVFVGNEQHFNLEAAFHRLFSEKRIEGEWFNLMREDLEFVKSLLAIEPDRLVESIDHEDLRRWPYPGILPGPFNNSFQRKPRSIYHRKQFIRLMERKKLSSPMSRVATAFPDPELSALE